MKSRRNWIRFGSIVVVILLIGWVGFSRVSGAPQTEEESHGGEGETSIVYVEEISEGTRLETLRGIGVLEPVEEIGLRSEVTGRVDSIDFEEGQAVEEGDLLLTLNTADFRARRSAEVARRDFLQNEIERRESVLDEGGVTVQEIDELRAELRVVEAQILEINAEVDRREIRAPFDGLIGLRSVSVGAVIDPGEELARLRHVDELFLSFTVPGRYATAVEEEMEILFQVDGITGLHRSRVFSKESGLEGDSGVLRVRGKIDNQEGLYFPGAISRVHLVLSQQEEILSVPTPAVIKEGVDSYVWVAHSGDQEKGREVQRRKVVEGQRWSDRVEILDGTEIGDLVIVEGHQELSDGDTVEVESRGDRAARYDREREGQREIWNSREELEAYLQGGDIDRSDDAGEAGGQ